MQLANRQHPLGFDSGAGHEFRTKNLQWVTISTHVHHAAQGHQQHQQVEQLAALAAADAVSG